LQDNADMKRRVCTTRDELVAVLMKRRDELDLTNAVLEAVSGVSDGYVAKVLSLTPIKRLGPMSLEALMGAMGLGICAVVIGEDPEAIAQVKARWERRRGRPRKQRRPVRKAKPVPEPEAPCSVRCSQSQAVFNFDNTGETDVSKMISARVDDELEERVRAAAAKERRTTSQFVRNILVDALDKPEPPASPKPEVTA
jgi:hypothetical protein